MWQHQNNWAQRKLNALKAAGQSLDRPYVFMTSCINAQGEDINSMTDNAREITLRTLRKYCDTRSFEKEMDYFRDSRQGLVMIKDSSVSYWKSTYQGVPCYYIDYSRIEYIYVKADEWVPDLMKRRMP